MYRLMTRSMQWIHLCLEIPMKVHLKLGFTQAWEHTTVWKFECIKWPLWRSVGCLISADTRSRVEFLVELRPMGTDQFTCKSNFQMIFVGSRMQLLISCPLKNLWRRYAGPSNPKVMEHVMLDLDPHTLRL